MFADLKKTSIQKFMPFSVELSEHTKFMALDTWLHKQLKNRKERLDAHSKQSKEWLEGFEQGLIDMALDTKNEIKRLEG